MRNYAIGKKNDFFEFQTEDYGLLATALCNKIVNKKITKVRVLN